MGKGGRGGRRRRSGRRKTGMPEFSRACSFHMNQADPLVRPEVVVFPSMATSPNTSGSGTLTPKKKDESFLEKIGTLARKKKIKEGEFW